MQVHAGIITLSQTRVDGPCRHHHSLTLTTACILPWFTDGTLHGLWLLIKAPFGSVVIIKNNAMQKISVAAQIGSPYHLFGVVLDDDSRILST